MIDRPQIEEIIETAGALIEHNEFKLVEGGTNNVFLEAHTVAIDIDEALAFLIFRETDFSRCRLHHANFAVCSKPAMTSQHTFQPPSKRRSIAADFTAEPRGTLDELDFV